MKTYVPFLIYLSLCSIKEKNQNKTKCHHQQHKRKKEAKNPQPLPNTK